MNLKIEWKREDFDEVEIEDCHDLDISTFMSRQEPEQSRGRSPMGKC